MLAVLLCWDSPVSTALGTLLSCSLVCHFLAFFLLCPAVQSECFHVSAIVGGF